MKKISKVATGTPLRQTNPAAVERYLLEKIRTDLGEYQDLATVKPFLRIDKEDGDLSGNVTDGFGTILLNVSGKAIHVPFIIHQKELLPFDTIRMGEEQVSYDISKLRQLVVSLDKKVKETASNGSEGDVMSVVDGKDVPTHNGFLGTIMRLRDEHRSNDMNGNSPWEGEAFGDLDDQRLLKRASASHIDVTEVFDEVMEKSASLKIFTPSMVEEMMNHIQKTAADESQKTIDSIANVKTETVEQNQVRREFTQLDKDRLVSLSRVKTGNDIVFPSFDGETFEYRKGRVYHKLKDMSDEPRKSGVTSLVLDTKGGYKFIKGNDKFMVSLREAPVLNFKTAEAQSLRVQELYAIEFDKETVSVPFEVNGSFKESEKSEGMFMSVPERAGKTNLLKASEGTLFYDSFQCIQRLPYEKTQDRFSSADYGHFTILISKKHPTGIMELSRHDVLSYISENAQTEEDHRISNRIAGYQDRIFLIGHTHPVFRLDKKICGHFTHPEGFLKEGPFAKTASYEQSNRVKLVVQKDSKPRVYAVEWSFSNATDVEGNEAYKLENKRMDGLSEAQARKVLADLGYDARKQEMFFEITKRNGRFAEFRLPSTDKAKSVTPSDKGVGKAKEALKNVTNATLNARNFTPVFENIMADGISTALADSVPQSVDWAAKLTNMKKESFDTAFEMEKVAEEFRGASWFEVAMLTNLKANLDKVAGHIAEGYVYGAEEIFEKTASLKPAIEKTAHSLIEFNRHQLLAADKPLVQPALIKEALQQLDGLYRYASVTEVLSGNMEKTSSFFHKGARKSIEEIEAAAKEITAASEKVIQSIRNDTSYLRALERKGSGTSDKAKLVQQGLEAKHEEVKEHAKQLGVLAKEKNELQNGIDTKNRTAMAGIGVPALVGTGYGYENFKNS